MTVGELRKILEKIPNNWEVFTDNESIHVLPRHAYREDDIKPVDDQIVWGSISDVGGFSGG